MYVLESFKRWLFDPIDREEEHNTQKSFGRALHPIASSSRESGSNEKKNEEEGAF